MNVESSTSERVMKHRCCVRKNALMTLRHGPEMIFFNRLVNGID